MISTPEMELERVLKKYAALRWPDLCFYVLATTGMFVASLFRQVDWYFFAGMLSGVLGWEVTKLRLRRNARDYVHATS